MPLPSDAATPSKMPSTRKGLFTWVWQKVTFLKGGFASNILKVTDFLTEALQHFTKLIAQRPDNSSSGTQEIQNPRTAKDFKQNLDIMIRRSNLSGMIDNSYLEGVAAKVAKLKDDPKNHLKESDQLGSLSQLALYQPILYCDDSGSMSSGTAVRGLDRTGAQAALVRRITSIATRAVPGNEGAHLCFINQGGMFKNLSPAEIDAKAQAPAKGGTALGENLRSKILKPMVYDVIDSGKPLARPLLILTITDGCPNTQDTFGKAIRECGEYLVNKGYQKAVVRFDLSQIGNDGSAAAFLQSLIDDKDISDVLHCTAEHLDAKFAELRDNDKKLEEWLLERLRGPIRTVLPTT